METWSFKRSTQKGKMISYILIIFTLFLIYYLKQSQRKNPIKAKDELLKDHREISDQIVRLEQTSRNKLKKYDRKNGHSSNNISNPREFSAPDLIRLNKPFYELPLNSSQWVTFLSWTAHAPILAQEEFLEMGINSLIPLTTGKANPTSRQIVIFSRIINYIFDEIIN